MSQKRDGNISASLFSLQLQLKTLLEEAGGDDALELLDTLSTLNISEQKIALKLFNRVLAKLIASELRLTTAEDRVLKEFEDGLYRDILDTMREAANCSETPLPERRLEVLPGGKLEDRVEKNPIDLNAARKSRKVQAKTVVN
jgi:hypothetical protein